MSSEAVKKRGRPKKVISDLVEVELPEASTKAKTRSKSTKAAPKAVKASTTGTAKTPTVTKPTTKPITTNSASAKSKSSLPPPPAKQEVPNPATPAQSPPKTITPTSKISEQVRSLSTKNGNETFTAKAEPPVKSNTMTPKSSPSSTSAQTPSESPPVDTTKPSTPLSSSIKPASSTRIPLAEMNSEIVSSLSTRAGARPNAARSKQLPPNYKSVARRFTATVVAIPIAVVTSYFLYQRLLGEDPKNIMRPAVQEPTVSLVEKDR